MQLRSRKGSLVQNIATHAPRNPIYYTNQITRLLDDEQLEERLRELTLNVESESFSLASDAVSPETTDEYQVYEQYVQELENKTAGYQKVLQQTQNVSMGLINVNKELEEISTSTRDFCSSIQPLKRAAEEESEVYETLEDYLSYFECLDSVVRKLNASSSPSAVVRESFKSMLKKIDASLEFLEKHPDFKECESYRIRFKQCMIRACALMASWMSSNLKIIYDKLSARVTGLAASSANSSTQEALLYNSFASDSSAYFSVARELTSRCFKRLQPRYHQELLAIVNDCYSEYFRTREKLLYPIIADQLNGTHDQRKPLVKYIQDNLLYFTTLCVNEYNLVLKFFPTEDLDIIHKWLFHLCEPLHEMLRSRILRELSIPSLCDCVILLNKYYQFEENSQEYEMQFKDVPFDKLFEPILQDIQSRLVFRSQVYVEKFIVGYKPSKDAFMISNRKKSIGTEDKNDALWQSYVENFTASDEEIRNLLSYYPPLVRSLALLSRIYQLVNSTVFDNLAHHIVHDCIISLQQAYRLVKNSENTLDTQLSYIRNLLMLRKQVQTYDIQFITTETYLDFSGLTDLFKTLSMRKDFKPHTSVITLALETVPKIVNNMIDARAELMVELRNIIKLFTQSACQLILTDCLEVTEAVSLKNIELRTNVQSHVPEIYKQVCNFVGDSEVINHLMEAVQQFSVESYVVFHEKLMDQIDHGRLPRQTLAEIMDIDVFSNLFSETLSALVTIS
ncbi:LAMI_0H11980g1_1 [Lachancea mirantina]|uniref:Conserved oligomeric Golgi complex subunit 3 n=1 Tax=Lachancea mirantina TaxID=1230905 RepID=A0A1G4KH89_9SACH|nr:LAMI_0H11980g1_1 [Lachancea mirantina]